MRIFLAKNRLGKELEEVLWWNGAKGEIRDMTKEEKEYYKETREFQEKEIYRLRKGF